MGLFNRKQDLVVVVATRTAGIIPLEEIIQHLEKICLGQRDPLSKDGKNLGRIWRNLLNRLEDDKVTTMTATRRHDVPGLLEEAAQYLKKACSEQWDLSIEEDLKQWNLSIEGDPEQTRRSLKGISVKTDAALLLYDLAKIFDLRETAQYLKKAYLKRREALSTTSMYQNLKGCLELIRRNLESIFTEDDGKDKTNAALLLYNGPDLAEIYDLRETPKYLRKVHIGWLISPHNTYQHRLKRIQQNLMRILKDNEAATCVLFYNGSNLTEIHSLVLNAADSIIAPRIEVPVPQQAPAQQEEGEEE